MIIRPAILTGLLILLSFIMPFALGLAGLYLSILLIMKGDVSGFTFVLLILSIGFISICWAMWKATKEKIIFGHIDNWDNLVLYFPIKIKKLKTPIKSIKGFSKSLDNKSYGTALMNRNCLTLYFNDLNPIEFVQYQISGIKEIESELLRRKIQQLGDEEITRDMWGARVTYKYE
jgi:hypothetical protein